MRLTQRPVADLWIQGDTLGCANRIWVNKAPQYSCNCIKCVKALGTNSRKRSEKFRLLQLHREAFAYSAHSWELKLDTPMGYLFRKKLRRSLELRRRLIKGMIRDLVRGYAPRSLLFGRRSRRGSLR